MSIEILNSKFGTAPVTMLGARGGAAAARSAVRAEPALVFAVDATALTFEIETLREKGRDVAVCQDLRQFSHLLGSPRRGRQGWSLVMVEIDGFGGIFNVIDKLLSLRQERPALPVILASKRLREHDLSTERLPICDVSIALPASAAELHLAVQRANRNNFAWQMNCAGIEDDEAAFPFE